MTTVKDRPSTRKRIITTASGVLIMRVSYLTSKDLRAPDSLESRGRSTSETAKTGHRQPLLDHLRVTSLFGTRCLRILLEDRSAGQEFREMQIPVLVERVEGNGFRARGGEPLALCAEGPTRAEAIARLRSLIAERLAVGAELINLDLEKVEHPLGPVPGWSIDDPLLDEWQEAIANYRQQVEEDPDR
jgi:hypothetical protein